MTNEIQKYIINLLSEDNMYATSKAYLNTQISDVVDVWLKYTYIRCRKYELLADILYVNSMFER